MALWQVKQEEKIIKYEKISYEEEKKDIDEPRGEEDERLEKIIIDANLIIPDYHEDLEEIKDEISNSQTIIAFLNKYFEFTDSTSYIAQEPEDFYQNRSGNSLDVAVFLANYLKPSIVSTAIIRYDFIDANNQEGSNYINILRDADASSRYISLCNNDNQLKMYIYGNSFEDLMDIKENKLNIDINRFGLFTMTARDFSDIREPFAWQEY